MMLGDLIKAWRQKRDLSVRDAAPQFDVSAATLSRLENGRPIDADTQLKLIVMLFTRPNREQASDEAIDRAINREEAPDDHHRDDVPVVP
jgi:transcriptional regulator with XRE-family HTH domain